MGMAMEDIMMFIKFKDSGEELGFTIDQLIKCSVQLFSKFNSTSIRKLEDEGERKKAEEKKARETELARRHTAHT